MPNKLVEIDKFLKESAKMLENNPNYGIDSINYSLRTYGLTDEEKNLNNNKTLEFWNDWINHFANKKILVALEIMGLI